MLLSVCDKCGAPTTTISRRFTKLSNTKHGELGLEVILLHDGSASPSHHICESCLPELLLQAAGAFPEASSVSKIKVATDYYATYKVRMEEREIVLAAKEKELDKTMIECKKKVEAAERKIAEVNEQKAVLASKLQVLQGTVETRIKQEVAAQRQHDADKKNDPQYTENVRRRGLAANAQRDLEDEKKNNPQKFEEIKRQELATVVQRRAAAAKRAEEEYQESVRRRKLVRAGK